MSAMSMKKIGMKVTHETHTVTVLLEMYVDDLGEDDMERNRIKIGGSLGNLCSNFFGTKKLYCKLLATKW